MILSRVHAMPLAAASGRGAAYPVVPTEPTIDTPCVLASLGFRSPETRQHHRKDH
jgi:hypothetical protein